MCVPETRSDQILKILPFKARYKEDKGKEGDREQGEVPAAVEGWAADREEVRGRERQTVPAAAEGWEMEGDGDKKRKNIRIKILIMLYKKYNILK